MSLFVPIIAQGSALQKVLFPIGHLTKAEVKAIAAQRLPGLKVLSKPESMGICFIGKRDMRDFLEDYITLTSGRYGTVLRFLHALKSKAFFCFAIALVR